MDRGKSFRVCWNRYVDFFRRLRKIMRFIEEHESQVFFAVADSIQFIAGKIVSNDAQPSPHFGCSCSEAAPALVPKSARVTKGLFKCFQGEFLWVDGNRASVIRIFLQNPQNIRVVALVELSESFVRENLLVRIVPRCSKQEHEANIGLVGDIEHSFHSKGTTMPCDSKSSGGKSNDCHRSPLPHMKGNHTMTNQSTLDKEPHGSQPAPKWAALVNDALYPMPRHKLSARDVLDQSGAPPRTHLVRDRGTPDDGGFDDNEMIDLAEGNVFLTESDYCGGMDRDHKRLPAKLAFVCDDAWEVTLVARQTGHSLKRLLGLADSSELYRDFEAPEDILIRDEEAVEFAEGCVFRARKHHEQPRDIIIIVNTREFPVKQRVLTYEYIVSLAFPNPDYDKMVYTVKYTDGVPPKPEGSMSPGDKVKVKNETIFSVTVSDKS